MKIKSILIFILSLSFLLFSTQGAVYAEIDHDYDPIGFGEDETTTTTTTTTTEPSNGGFKLGSSNNDSSDEEEEEEFSGGNNNPPRTTTKTIVGIDESGVDPDEETTSTSEESCEHNYVIVAFNCETGMATISCTKCKNTYNDYFANHVSGRKVAAQNPPDYDPIFDVVNDGVINGKDYAYLMQQYYDDFSINDIFDSHEFLFKEQFGYIYITVLMIIITMIICLSMRRFSK